MGEFAPLIERLSDDRLEGLDADDMGVHNLRDVVALLRVVRTELEAGEALLPEEITQTVRGELLNGNFANQIDALINGMGQYGATTENPNQERNKFRTQAENLRNLAIDRLRPIVRPDAAQIKRLAQEVEKERELLAAARAELSAQMSALAQSSATTAANDLSHFYEAEAKSHGDTANTFFWAGVVAGVVLALITVYTLFVEPPSYDTSETSEQWIDVVRGTVARLAVLSLAAFALAFCVRNYRVNMHLEVLNKRRENALNTFGLMQASVTTDDARNIVVSELVRAIFTSEETGYLAVDSERTVIESPGSAGILSAMTARGPA